MKNLKIGAKLAVSFGIVIVLLIGSMAVSLQSMSALSSKVEYYSDQAIPVINSMWTARRAMVSAERSLYRATTSDDLALNQENIQAAEAELDKLKDVIAILRESYSGDQQDVEKFYEMMNSTVDLRTQICDLLAVNRNVEALKLMEEQYLPVFTEAGEHLVSMADGVQSRVDEYSAQAKKDFNRSLIFLIILAVFSTIVAIVVCILIIRSIKKPIIEIQSVAQRLSQGDLSAEITYESKDELGELSGYLRSLVSTFIGLIDDISFGMEGVGSGNFKIESKAGHLYIGDFLKLRNALNLVITSLTETLTQINLASDQVSSGSDQVASGAQNLSQGATEQASAVEELAATINEISEQVNRNAASAVEASNKANSVGEEVLDSNRRMQSMLAAMGDISNSSNEIGKIIKTIEDIAFQTNILALNAAVEAARAGAAGKGFAVVADEVRNLASKSAEASKNTSALIETSIRAVENGTKIADETAQSLNAVVEGAKDVVDIIDKISAASKQQADSVRQVTAGVDQISSVVQTNSATAEESAATSEELSGQAQTLRALIGAFKL